MIFRLLFLILFLIICILFTAGYYLLPIINFENNLYKGIIYINKINISDNTSDTKLSFKYDESNIDSNYKMILKYLYYGCIVTSCLIIVAIIFSYLRMKFISKILFILSQTFMTTFVGLIVFMYYSSSFIKNIIPIAQSKQDMIPEEYRDVSTSYGSGGILMIISTIAMIINFILYSFIG